MNKEQRVIYQTTDISKDVNDYKTGSFAYAPTTTDYLYIGSVLPFNNIWLKSLTPNTTTGIKPIIQIWYNNQWTAAVDVVDETLGLTQSGRLQWGTHYDRSWDFEDKTADIPELNTFSIYNMYWMRISWDTNFDLTTTLDYVGQKFSNDVDLGAFYPDLLQAGILETYKTGKTTWDDQHYMAAEHIVRDLRKGDIIKSRSQILEHSLFTDASCHKVAEIVYTAFGPSWLDMKNSARNSYLEALDMKHLSIDKNADGKLDPVERTEFGTGWMKR